MVYQLDDSRLGKLPRSQAHDDNLKAEYEATTQLAALGIAIPEMFLCKVSGDGIDYNALVKSYITGFDLNDMMLALTTTSCSTKIMYPC